MEIPLEIAKSKIIEAVNDFDHDLGRRAAEILFNDDRMNIIEVAEARTSMMACRPAGLTIEDLKARDMYMPDFVQKYGPHFTQQDNPANYAIIDYEYDGSLNALEYLAHELGHAIADDIQREQGRSFRDFTDDELEQQAYFVQKIVTHAIAELAQQPYTQTDIEPLKLSFERINQMKAAETAFNTALAMDSSHRTAMVPTIMGGVEMPKISQSGSVTKTLNLSRTP